MGEKGIAMGEGEEGAAEGTAASRRAAGWAKRVASAAALLFWLVLFWLLGRGVPLADAILIGALVAGLPGLTLAQLPLVGVTEIRRLPAYWSSMAVHWLLGSASWLVGTAGGAGPEGVGLAPIGPVALAAWSGALLAGGLLVMLASKHVTAALGADESRALRALLPRSAREKRVFALLSLTAGLAEELAYRGYLILTLAPLLGTAGAAVLSSLLFGVVHAYQGVLGVARTAVLGGALAAGFLVAGSLWPAIVGHALIDLVGGLVLGEGLLPPADPAGVGDGSDQPPPEDGDPPPGKKT
ncbi:MAG TPA: CPBP family intramembrane glutamic endopeptidase [Longimicrobiales bacterium]|nr:CPBP family intramembrane glutamic endopeptidase [Longimicrobiales bacterium]